MSQMSVQQSEHKQNFKKLFAASTYAELLPKRSKPRPHIGAPKPMDEAAKQSAAGVEHKDTLHQDDTITPAGSQPSQGAPAEKHGAKRLLHKLGLGKRASKPGHPGLPAPVTTAPALTAPVTSQP